MKRIEAVDWLQSRVGSESLGHVGDSHDFCSVLGISPGLVAYGPRLRHQFRNGGNHFVVRGTGEGRYGEAFRRGGE